MPKPHAPYPPLYLLKGKEKSYKKGHPWIFKDQLQSNSAALLDGPGSLVTVMTLKQEVLGIATYNPDAVISCRVLSQSACLIDTAFFIARFQTAKQKRDRLIGKAFYRLIHSEADGCPGLIIDLFGPYAVCQVSTAGMEQLMPYWLTALDEVIHPSAILLRNDIPSRKAEGLETEVRLIKGTIPDLIPVEEYDVTFLADLFHGQKTGWFYDQRDNRAMIAGLAKGKRVFDIFSHSGGFALPALKAGAASVLCIDSSAKALGIARKSSTLNNVDNRLNIMEMDAVRAMMELHSANAQADIVLVDPPAYIKSKNDIAAGLKGYSKLAYHAAPLVAPGGLLFVASCSHHAEKKRFLEAVLDGVKKAKCSAELLSWHGAAKDHPSHPLLPQNDYLKAVLLRVKSSTTLTFSEENGPH